MKGDNGGDKGLAIVVQALLVTVNPHHEKPLVVNQLVTGEMRILAYLTIRHALVLGTLTRGNLVASALLHASAADGSRQFHFQPLL